MEGWVTLIHLFAYFVVSGTMLSTEKLWKYFFQTSVAVSLLVGGYGVLQLMGKAVINQGGVRLDSTFGNASYLGAYFLFHIFITGFLLLGERLNRRKQYIYGAIILFQLFILYNTATRGAVLALGVGLFTMLVLVALFEKENKTLRKISFYALGSLCVIGLILVGLHFSPLAGKSKALERLTTIKLDDLQTRFSIWNIGWQGVKEKPFFGWGQESFNYVFNKYYKPSLFGQEQWFDRTHNIVFDWLVAGGIFGFLSFVSIFIVALYYLWHHKSPPWFQRGFLKKLHDLLRPGTVIPFSPARSAVLTGFFAAYLVHNLFVFDNIGSYIIMVSVLAYLHALHSTSLSDKWEKRLNIDEGLQNRLIIPIIVVSFVFIIYFASIKPILAGHTLIKAFGQYGADKGGPAENLRYFNKALSYNSFFGRSEIREQITQAANQVISSNVDISLKQSFYDLVRSEMTKQLKETPNDARYYVFFGSFLNRVGAYDEALLYLSKGLELSPNKQSIMFEVGSSYINQKKYKEALDIFKKAYELDTNFWQAKVLYVAALIYNKETDLVKKLTKEMYGRELVYEDVFIRAYSDLDQYGTVLALLKEREKGNPDDPELQISLAATYLKLGERTNAVKAVEKAIMLRPSFKEQGEYYIREIKAGRNP